MRRRDFLATAGVALSAPPALLATRDSRPPAFPPPGLQLYSLRTEMKRDLEGTLRRLGAMGYREVEFAGYFGRTPAQVREQYGMTWSPRQDRTVARLLLLLRNTRRLLPGAIALWPDARV